MSMEDTSEEEMIVNYLRFSFKENVPEEDKRTALNAISKTATLKSVSFSTVGQDLGNPADGYTHAYCVGIKDLETLDHYLSDPVHRRGDFVFLPLLEKLTRTAMSDDYDDSLGKKISELYMSKMNADPEWFALVKAVMI